ncbi:MAG: hypothetical protein A3F61_00485 [Candidatus Blackburnbacteria bacterium RIFCSPHIGHO2_12_FULL_41_13b]|uniref:Uncharacterized protein n=2 Tax=Candidatus Blackburniibacteriota TaxID=1817898 RepID=A0A1G1V9T5_9BACT|nr:MAG: hypothetical protein A3F61_00485 [Candidatus Blackburnbacteria bacterium RIFCSPHIGHO2_12_FULL_41_13b]
MMRINKTEIKTKNRAWIVLFTILSVVIIAQLLASNYLAGKGEYLSLLEKKASLLTRENQTLQEELSQKASLTKLAVEAQDSGFTKAENIMYLDTSLPVAALPQ